MIPNRYYYIIPATSTSQERSLMEDAISKLVGILNIEGQNLVSGTEYYSTFIEHPSDGRFIYAIDGDYLRFFNSLPSGRQRSYAPSTFTTGADNTLRDKDYVTDQGWFPGEEPQR